jgi:hypothetical protein
MKQILTIIFLLLAGKAFCQSAADITPQQWLEQMQIQQRAQQQQQYEAQQRAAAAEAARFAKIPNQYRVFGGKIYNLKFNSVGLESISADVQHIYTNCLQLHWKQTRGIFERHSYGGLATGNFLGGGVVSHQVGTETVFDKQIIVLNYPVTNVAEGQKLNFSAMQLGTTNFNGDTLELWDCGIITNTPPPEEVAAAKAQAELEAKRRAAEKKKFDESQARSFVWLQTQASNGLASSQCSLGLRYLNGQGCESNKDLAVHWLKIASANGDVEASNKLVKITSQ